MTTVPNGVETLPKISIAWVGCTNVFTDDRRQTDDRRTDDDMFAKNFVADFLQAKCDFRRKSAVMRFWAPPPLWGLGATYDDHLIGKRIVDFLLVLTVLTELFSLGVTAEALQANMGWKSAISLQRGPL